MQKSARFAITSLVFLCAAFDVRAATPAFPDSTINGSSLVGVLATAPKLVQQEGISNPVSTIAPTYLGSFTFPQPNLLRVANGHVQYLGQTGSWGSQTDLVSVVANGLWQNNGNQGNYWDPNYRLAYNGQDAAALFISIQARTPELAGVGAASFGTTTITTPMGNRTVYTTTLTVALTLAQMADLATRPPNLRMELSNGFWGYLIAPGQTTPAGVAVPPVSADGTTLVIDNWVCGTCSPQVPASAAALPSSVGTGPYTLTLDVTHQIDMSYGGASVSDADQVVGVNGMERVFANGKVSQPRVNLSDPLNSTLANGTPFLMVGQYGGVMTGPAGGSGVGTAYAMAGAGWQTGFVARNAQVNSAEGSTYGFLTPQQGPTWGFYSTQNSGYVLGVDPADSCSQAGRACKRTILLDTVGNLTLAAQLKAASISIEGFSTVSGGLNVNGQFTVYNPVGTGSNLHIDGNTGNLVTKGALIEALATPTSSSAHCLTGQMQDDVNYHYVCVAPNTWKRAALSSF